MPDDVRIGVEPEPAPPPRSSRLLVVAAVLVLLAAAGAWLAGAFSGDTTTTTAVEITFATTTTSAAATTTLPLEERLSRAAAFWGHLGSGGAAAAAAAAFPEAGAAATDLMGFVAAFHPGFLASECEAFAANAVQCTVTVTNAHLITIGLGTASERLLVDDDGWFDVPVVLGSSAARLSLYALDAHTEELRAACPLTENPQAPRLAIVGSATTGCGAYLAGLIPEYLAAQGLG
jgi:drug/metabolite transporter (DMT)-like permease